MTKTVENVTCIACDCLCDDLTVQISDGNQIQRLEKSCALADSYFSKSLATNQPAAKKDGETAPFKNAVQTAVEILQKSQSPLIFGSEYQSTDVYRAACALADRIGATIDSYGSQSRAASMIALQNIGMSTASLGEIKNRADLVLLFGCDPVTSHPRLMERIFESVGEFVPDGRSGRTLLYLNDRSTSTSELCDSSIRFDAGKEYELIGALRAMLKGIDLLESSIAGVAIDDIVALVERMKTCRYGVVLFGAEFSKTGHSTVESLFQLVRELNSFTRFVVSSLQNSRTQTAANVLAWQTGFPGSVNLGQGYPRYNPGEFSANEMLETQEADAAILLGSSALDCLSEQALLSLKDMPTILISGSFSQRDFNANVEFTTAIAGIHHSGTAYRLDDVPIPLKQIVDSSLPTAKIVLSAILDIYTANV